MSKTIMKVLRELTVLHKYITPVILKENMGNFTTIYVDNTLSKLVSIGYLKKLENPKNNYKVLRCVGRSMTLTQLNNMHKKHMVEIHKE